MKKFNMSITRRGFGKGLVGAAIVGSVLPVGAPSASAQAADELKVAYGALGANRHPHSISNLPDTDIANLLFDPLLTRSADGAIQGGLADQFEQVEENRWRFVLRKDATFRDGRPVTSADAKFSLENYLSPETLNRYLYQDWFDRVEIIDDLTFDVVSKKPYRVALANMAYLSHIVPSDSKDAQAFAAQPVGSGPYRFVEFVPNDRVVVEANPVYWGKKPAFSRIVFRQIAESSTRLAALEAGEVDFAVSVPIDDVPDLKEQGFRVEPVVTMRTMFVRYNLLADSPFKDVRVRQALNHSVDRQGLRQGIIGGLGSDAQSPIANGIKYRVPQLPAYDYDLAKARQLLTEAGYPDGFEVSLATPVGRWLKDREFAEAIAGQLEQVGIRIQIVPLEWATYLQQIRAERTTTGLKYALSLQAWGNLIGDADFSFAPLDSRNSDWNLGGYSNEKLQALIEQGRATFDEGKLAEIYAQAQQEAWTDAPWLFLFDLPTVDAMSPNIGGYVGRADEQIRWNDITKAG